MSVWKRVVEYPKIQINVPRVQKKWCSIMFKGAVCNFLNYISVQMAGPADFFLSEAFRGFNEPNFINV